jgi:1,4-alpha-glucan branching enzyme
MYALIEGRHGDPFSVLGPHPREAETTVIRALRPTASAMTVLLTNDDAAAAPARVAMTRLREEGLFEAEVPGAWPGTRYRLESVEYDGQALTLDDPYAFPPVLTEFDLHLLAEGRYLYSYEKLGAHPLTLDGPNGPASGVHFAVWAPNAESVSVIGDFNRWDKRVHPMRFHPGVGVWELFIPGLDAGAVYRYHVRSRLMGYQADKTDPYGFYNEMRPMNASVVADLSDYTWGDDAWMTARAEGDPLKKPMSIYEVHPGSWRRDDKGEWLNYRELAHQLVDYVKEMGYTHIELLPITEHPLDKSWGYQVTGYYAVTSRYGTPEDFMYFVDYCHQHSVGVILDWVPAHFPKDGHALAYFDGTHLYEHADPRRGEHPDWGTYIFNYGRNEVRNFLLSNALFWLKVYHLDGLRVDAVSSMIYLSFSREAGQWLPNEFGGSENLEAIAFMREFNAVVHAECPGAVTIAEEATSWPMVSRPAYIGGLGFTFKWNMGWMHDTLEYIRFNPIFRRYHHNKMTFSMMYAFTENFVLALSHDEVVHGKGSLMGKVAGDWWQKFATLRLLLGYMATHPGKKLLFMGQEFGQWNEWWEARGLDWYLLDLPTHRGVQAFARDANHFYQREPSLWQRDFDSEGFLWIDANDAENSVYSYIRFADDRADFTIAILNFTPVVRHHYRIGVPVAGTYREALNSDSAYYGGSNVGNGGRDLHSEPQRWHQFDNSLTLTLPPLGALVLKRVVAASEAVDLAPSAAQDFEEG